MPTSPELEHQQEMPMSLVSLTRRLWIPSPPTPLNPIIGREYERESAITLIHNGARLVTLTGGAGMGKTRLALQLSTDLKDTFSDGVAWLPLATVREVDRVVPAIVKGLRIESAPNAPALRTLELALADAHLLLVLDNLEQVLAAGSELATLLASCPRLAVMTTSRSPLRVSGEHIVNVQPLDIPEPAAESAMPVTLTGSERLFIDRAGAIAPGFTVAEGDAPIVADICRRLEGVPLAIELAAARVSLLPLPALQTRLDRRLPLLAGGARDQPARHRTMRDAIAWSYELLTEQEQARFRCLAIYSGGFRLDAAGLLHPQSPGEAPHADLPGLGVGGQGDPLDHVARLVDQSLLQRTADPDGEPRFVMLEAVREFALEQLEERDFAERARVAYLFDLAERAELSILVPEGQFLQAVLELEHENIRQALAWLHANNELDVLQRLVGMLARTWFLHGRFDVGIRWLELAVASGDQGNDASYAKALIGLALFVGLQGDGARSDEVGSAGLAILREANEPAHTAVALIFLGAMLMYRGDHDRAESMFQEALETTAAINDHVLATSIASTALTNLGVVAHSQGRLGQANGYQLQALALSREINHLPGETHALRDLGDVTRDAGELARSLDHYRQGLVLAVTLRELLVIVDVFRGTALIASAWNQPERAGKLIGAANAMSLGAWTAPRLEFDRIAHEQVIEVIRVTLGDTGFADALAAGAAMSLDEAVAEVMAIEQPAETVDTLPVGAISHGLTPREVEVLRGIAEHLTDREIGERLFISRRTVSGHVAGILNKLGVESRREAARLAAEEDLF